MANFENSPGVYDTETDLTTTVPAVATSTGAIAGLFRWGPVDQKVLVDSETTLVSRFGTPTNYNAETFFTGANFLAYSNQLFVVRTANTSAPNTTNIINATTSAVATLNTSSTSNTVIINSTVKNYDDFQTKNFDASVFYVAKYPGALGNSLKVSVCDNANSYMSTVNLVANSTVDDTLSNITFTVGSNTAVITVVPSGSGSNVTSLAVASAIADSLTVGDLIKAGESSTAQYIKITNVGAAIQATDNATVTISLSQPYNQADNYSSNNFVRTWEYFGSVNRAPGASITQLQSANPGVSDELHVVVTDEDGAFTGVPGAVLEVFESLSRATNAKDESGRSIFYKNVINDTSNYVWAASDRVGASSGSTLSITSSTNNKPMTISLARGQDGLDENDIPLSTIVSGYDQFKSPEAVDISIIMQGKAKGGANGAGLANYIIGNIAEDRRDCVATISPERSDVVNALGNEVENLTAFRNSVGSSSYAIMDTGYKYQYDKYNDVYRYIPLNGDIAGLIARTDSTNDPWYSPAGFTRGRIKNVVKLAFNPTQAQRDLLYKLDINPVVSLPAQGPVLYGDKTLLGRPSAFGKINVRRLFIVVRKSISQAARDLLFEFNDEFTRAQFINIVDPYLRSVEGRRGITAYRVKCDEENNPPSVVDVGGFVGDVYITPAHSINVIQLNFVATRTGVEFEEIVGRF